MMTRTTTGETANTTTTTSTSTTATPNIIGPLDRTNDEVPATPSEALARLRTKSISHPLQQCQITIYAPPNTAGAVIGRGGRTILNVQKEAMRQSLGHTGAVRISVSGGSGSPSAQSLVDEAAFSSQQQPTWRYPELRSIEDEEHVPIVIRGDPLGCFAAARLILPLICHRHDSDVVLEVPIHRSRHSLLVGTEGRMVAALSAQYNVRIMVPPTANRDGELPSAPLMIHSQSSTLHPNAIQLEGTLDAIELCLVKMLSIVAGEKWNPPGVIVSEEPRNHSDTSNGKAFAVVTANHDSPNIGPNKIRTVQRKTNTLVRKKKGRFFLKGIEYGFNASSIEDTEKEPSFENEDDEKEEDAHATVSKASISFLLSGNLENVKLAATQLEKLLRLEPDSAVIT